MPRPSQNTEQRLIQAALELLPETGFLGLKLRRVAQRAGVNLGMFYYHFRNKREFNQRVLREIYEKFYAQLVIETSRGANPKAQLRQAVATLARFSRNHRTLLLALGRDIMDNNQQVIHFLEENVHRHVLLVTKLIRRCRKSRTLARMPVPAVLAVMMGMVAGPCIIMALVESTKLRKPYEIMKKSVASWILSDQALEQRLELAFKALAPGGKRAGQRSGGLRQKSEG